MIDLIFCTDENYGLAFNNRRQSKDKEIAEYIRKYSSGNIVYAAPYSRDFLDINNACFVGDLKKINHGTVFAELEIPKELIEHTDTLTIFNWNRKYPADSVFDETLLDNFILLSESEIKGYSHEKITVSFYIRKNIEYKGE